MARSRWTVAAVAVAGAAANAQPLQDVTVTATPLGDTPLQSSQPVSVLRGAELDRRRGTSLGETLDGLPGVHSSGFGTAASRPVIRGFSGPRVGIKENGLDTMDASALSPDHAVAVDPLEARQVEVLRGPATLLYGSGSIGGLVNAVSDRIPTSPQGGLRGDALLGFDSASREKLGSLRLRGGWQPGARPADGAAPARSAGGSLNWTLGAFDRDAKDYAIPGNAVRGDPSSASGRLPNSFAESRGLSGGVSWTDRWGAAGLSHSGIDSRYGIPSEDGVFIDLRNRRTEGLVELDAPLPGLETVRLRTADVRYRHREVEGASGEVGTAFDSSGRDTRLDAVHLPLLGIRGALGLHSRQRTLSASGEEAYVPSTRERENALFWVGERAIGPGRLEFGLRQGRATRTPDAASGFDERRFDLTSYSLGGVVPVFGPVALSVSAGSSQRAPAIEELYANGTHAATRTFEIGDPTLAKERSRNIEVALRQATGPLRWKAGAYRQRFSSYVAGFSTDEDGDGVADRVDNTNTIANSVSDPTAGEYTRLAYRQAPATFTGFELEAAWQPVASPWTLRGTADRVRGTVEGFGAAPRTPPLRIGLTADYAAGPWAGFVSVLRASAQTRTAPLETETPGYTRVDAEVSYGWSLGADRRATLFVQGRNLLNEDIRLATSFVRDVVPMPGRSVWAGLRLRM
ncbi:MAG: TonB-dependent receptor [Burkholderiaceae bacterium]|nr:TonB-dependent receptor [Burkholderiales bacterium]MCZ8102111.1 TonB-dependent receptor [Burkholderiales bacterium]MCZ8340334.1 TonB-dependent receptor [Burkholderiaceae bacterium]